MEIATRVMLAATLDEVNTGRHHIVTADRHVGRRMCKATLLLLAIARAAQKLTTHLTEPHVVIRVIPKSQNHGIQFTEAVNFGICREF